MDRQEASPPPPRHHLPLQSFPCHFHNHYSRRKGKEREPRLSAFPARLEFGGAPRTACHTYLSARKALDDSIDLISPHELPTPLVIGVSAFIDVSASFSDIR